jgi:hypothetical protein
MTLRSVLWLALLLELDSSSSAPSTVQFPTNLDGGTLAKDQPSIAPLATAVVGQMYKQRFQTDAAAVEGCQSSSSCKNAPEHCRAVPYILAQIRCDKTTDGSTTTMLCEEPTTCPHNPQVDCMFAFECEQESPLFDHSTTWNNNNRADKEGKRVTEPRFRTQKVRLLRGDGPGPLTKKVLQLHSAGDVLNQHKPWPPPEAEAYANKLLSKSRLNAIGSKDDALPTAKLYPSEELALEQCQSSHRCSAEHPCEAREIVAERIGAYNNFFSFECKSNDEDENEEPTHQANGFDKRTGMPEYDTGEGTTALGTKAKSMLGQGIYPTPTAEHPIDLRKMPLFDPEKENKKKTPIFGR